LPELAELIVTPIQGLTLAALAMSALAAGIVPEPFLRMAAQSLVTPFAR
jgi:hypothetical protein